MSVRTLHPSAIRCPRWISITLFGRGRLGAREASMRSWIVVLVVLGAFGPGTPAREAVPARQVGASISGRVVDGATKAPVARARVSLSGSASQRQRVLTDDAGVFVFHGLPAGTYVFVIERDGYLPTSWPDSSRWIRRQESLLELAANDNVQNLTLAIERGGVVAGKVMSANGDPITGAQVSLTGGARATFIRTGTTNDLGDYRIAELPPGRYVLRAQLRALTSDSPDSLLSGPLPTYYPGTLQRTEAQELIVRGGGAVTEANLRLVEGMLSLLDVTVRNADGSR